MGTCFVIQPFDGGAFDKRYDDILIPAIKAAGLTPYRVDRDPAVSIPIDKIEDEIRRSDICLADISANNPNVWFELGYAFAAGKEVVMVSEFGSQPKFPFDIQHRSVTQYKTDAPSDFEELKNTIIRRLKALLAKEEKLGKIGKISSIAPVEGLTPHEMALLVVVAENMESPKDRVASHVVKRDMEQAGYTRIAVMLGLSSLSNKGMVNFFEGSDQDGNQFTVYAATPDGLSWLEQNQERLLLKKGDEIEEVPF
jgi:hypothetical protein